jgi:hypothetical protein
VQLSFFDLVQMSQDIGRDPALEAGKPLGPRQKPLIGNTGKFCVSHSVPPSCIKNTYYMKRGGTLCGGD